jgi:hypothetical protein
MRKRDSWFQKEHARGSGYGDGDSPVTRIVIVETRSEGVIGAVLRGLGSPGGGQGLYVEKVDMSMRDSYSISGQAGAVGPAAESGDGMFAQFSPPSARDTSLVLQQRAVILCGVAA